MSQPSTKPYLIRAIHQWCGDNGFTPYLAVLVDAHTMVPREYVRNGEIVLNVSMTATHKLDMGNDFIEFQARFNGKARDISIPVGAVSAIYARENGQGMSFEVTRAEEGAAEPEGTAPAKPPARRAPRLKAVASGADEEVAAASETAPVAVSQTVPAEIVPAEVVQAPADAPETATSAVPASEAPEVQVPQSPQPAPAVDAAPPTGDVDPSRPTGGKPRLTRIK